MKVERSGAERTSSIGREYQARLFARQNSPTQLTSSSEARAASQRSCRGRGPALSQGHQDPDGMYASWRITLRPSPTTPSWSQRRRRRASTTCSIKWSGRSSRLISCSGTIMTATQQPAAISAGLLQLASRGHAGPIGGRSAESWRGERAVIADGTEYIVNLLKAKAIRRSTQSKARHYRGPSAVMARRQI